MSFNAAVIYWVSDSTRLWVPAGFTDEPRSAVEDFMRSQGYTVTGMYKVPAGVSNADLLKANRPGVLFR